MDWLLGPQVREDVPGPSDPSTALSIPTRDAAARAVASGEAFGLSMVFRAIQVLATSVGALSLDAYRDDQELKPAPLFIRQPDLNESRPAFLEMTTVSLASQGNAYWRVFRDAQGRVNNIQVLNPLDVLIDATSGGVVKAYRYHNKIFAPSEIQHLKFLRVPGSVKALGPIQAAQAEIRGVLDVRDYAANWFQVSGVPSGVLATDQFLSKEQADAAAAQWDSTPAGRTRVTGNGLNYKTTFLSPSDAQFLESQQFSVTQMARLFGMPSSLMLAAVEGGSQTYQNIAQDWLAFYKFTLAKYTREIETAFSALLPRGTEARFNYEAFLRVDTETRYKVHAAAIQMGLYSAAYARQIEGIPESAAPKVTAPKPAPAPQNPTGGS